MRNKNDLYKKKYDLVLGFRYGSEGIMPCHKNSNYSCIGSSGENFCGGYYGHEEIVLNGKKFYVVKCVNDMECMFE